MLSTQKLMAGAVGYYESTVARVAGVDLVDYYGEHGEAPPAVFVAARPGGALKAHRAASQMLGIIDRQRLEREQIEAWFNEHRAPNGRQLGQKLTESSVSGWDLTLAAPKTVSLILALGSDEQAEAVRAAHDQAIRIALEYAADHAGYVRTSIRGSSKKRLVRTVGLTGVAYEHVTSRAEDPHLHTHVLVCNKQLSEDGAIRSLDGDSLLAAGKAIGAVYQAALRAAVTDRLGLVWEAPDPDTGLADLAGIPRQVIEDWSRRNSQITQWLDEQFDTRSTGGHGTRAQARTGLVATRERKQQLRGRREWREVWQSDARAAAVQIARPLVSEFGSAQLNRPPSPTEVLRHLARDASTFTRSDVVASISALWVPTGDPRTVLAEIERLADQVVASASCLSANPTHHEGLREPWERESAVRYTSSQVLTQEADLLRSALAWDDGLAVRARSLSAVQYGTLSSEQRRAVSGIALSRRRVTALVAAAGTGKTTTLRALRAVYEADGRRVVAVAPTGRSADEMAAARAAEQATTVAAMLQRLASGATRLDRNSVLVIDEAGMVGTQDLALLMGASEAAGVKVVAVGDPAQLAPVRARAGMFDVIAEDATDTQALGEVWRQHDEGERDAALALRDGSAAAVAGAADFYAGTGRLAAGSIAAMLDDAFEGWSDDVAAGRDAFLIAPRWEFADALNLRAQAERRATGHVHGEGVRAAQDQVIHLGDTVLTTRNDNRIPITGTPVRNGNRWEVVGLTDSGVRVRRRDGAIAVLPHAYVRDHVRLGYATTVHAAQGATSDTCHAVLDAATTRRDAAYVAASRGRYATRLYVAESQPGYRSEGHAVTDSIQTRWRCDVSEAAEKLACIGQREGRDRSAHEILRRSRAEYRAEQLVRIPEPAVMAWDDQRLALASQTDHLGVDPMLDGWSEPPPPGPIVRGPSR